MRQFTAAIATRSFDLMGPALEKLMHHAEILFINREGRRLSEADLCTALRGVQGVIAGTEPYTRRVMESLPDVMVISRVGVGLDSIDLPAARERRIQVCTTPEAPVQAVAEHTVALIMAILKQIATYNDAMRRGDPTLFPGGLLAGKTVGVVGLGRIGHRVASILSCMGCKIVYYDPLPKKDLPQGWEEASSLEELATRAEILTLHASAVGGDQPLINARILDRCQKGMILVNTARGSLVDEDALAEALEKRKIGGAGLDVFAEEPYHGRLLSYPQVIVTPHVASHTIESRRRMEEEAVENLVHAMQSARM